MTAAAVTLVIAGFLFGALTAVFVMLVVGIRAGERTRSLTGAPTSRLEVLARTLLRVGVRTGHLASSRDGEKD
jgi:hypothetical protein